MVRLLVRFVARRRNAVSMDSDGIDRKDLTSAARARAASAGVRPLTLRKVGSARLRDPDRAWRTDDFLPVSG